MYSSVLGFLYSNYQEGDWCNQDSHKISEKFKSWSDLTNHAGLTHTRLLKKGPYMTMWPAFFLICLKLAASQKETKDFYWLQNFVPLRLSVPAIRLIYMCKIIKKFCKKSKMKLISGIFNKLSDHENSDGRGYCLPLA